MRSGDENLRGVGIAHIIDTDGPGGAEQVVAHLARSLQEAGARNVALLPEGGEGWLGRQLEGSGVAIDYFPVGRTKTRACVAALQVLFRRHRIALAHSHEFAMAVYGAWGSWRSGIPHVITMHGGRYYAERIRRRLALRAAVALSGRTVAVSTPLARHIVRDLRLRPSRVAMIPNGVRPVPPGRITLRGELALGPNDRLAVSVGNLYPVKGHGHLLDAVARLDRHPRLHLAIAGRGELADPLAAQARALGIAPRVHLLGLRADVAALLAAADVFVLPSLSEGMPLALLEAMFAGRPIVATNVGEVARALAGGEAGVLVEPGNPAALAQAIDGVLSDPRQASEMGGRAAARAVAEYDVSRMVRRYIDTYRELLGCKPSPSDPRRLARKLLANGAGRGAVVCPGAGSTTR